MKKRLLILVGFLLCFTYVKGQDQSDHLLFTGSGAADYKSPANNLNMQMQIGNSIPYSLVTNSANSIKSEFGFPYNVLYIPPTFIVDRFEISKGYFTDRVNIKWEFGANQASIQRTEIFRKELGSQNPYQLIASVGADVFEYNDTQVDGGVLFSYIVRAIGVPLAGGEKRTINFMDGVGFRNPTATVSGGITYEGGSPVKDVIVFAEPIGAENSAATSLKLSNGFASIQNMDVDATNITLQVWLAGNSRPFEFTTSNGDTYTIDFIMSLSNRILIDGFKNSTRIINTQIEDYFPSGKLDAAGNDVLLDIDSTVNDETFFHFSMVLQAGKKPIFYLNGRPLTEEYDNQHPELSITNNRELPIYNPGSNPKINQISIRDRLNRVSYVDEFRLWDRALSTEEIRRDYRRYLGGNENGLKTYLRMDERVGNFLYDLSKVGFNQNKNDAFLTPTASNGIAFSDTRPSQQQLGIFGVTDKNGSYIISGISYKGTGESFVITPSLGVHEFEPASQTLFLGSEESVVNQLNFKDISSFKFNGRVVYNVQNVFNPIETSEPTNLRDSENYNQYLLGNTLINKGEYYYEGGSINASSGFYEGGTLKRYPIIGIEDANVLIDGNIVFDADNQPIVTDNEGFFTVSVPIGNHKVEVVKEGHIFELNGRFPERGTFEFFEDQIETRYFIDKTRVTLVGKVVGGKNEFEKPIGFGYNGEREHINFEGLETESKETISSINNIGVAQITFKGDVNSPSLDKIITTNPETGEYKVALIPYQYQILQTGITIPTNTDITVLNAGETLDLREVPTLETSVFTTKDDTELISEEYHYEKSFRYNSEVSVYLLEQEFDTDFTIGKNTFDISHLSTPIYTQKKPYKFTFEVVQEYINKDDATPVTTKEFFSEGTFNITNNLASSGTEKLRLINNNTEYVYTFNAGLPNITLSDGFEQNISVQYIIDGSSPLNIKNSDDFKASGIIKGGRPSAGKTFVTSAPESPDIILRDPPGTNSFASIEKGTTFVTKTVKSRTDGSSSEDGLFVSLGPDLTFSKGVIFEIETTINAVNDIETNVTKTTENTAENETISTYTFNQTISTSDDPKFVGAAGDLFIGNSKNIYYGVFDNMFITENIPTDKNNATIPNIAITVKDKDGVDKVLYVSTRKDYFIAEQPTNTFFSYSQNFILTTLIPELERLAATGTTPNTDGLNNKSSAFYAAQADLWRKVIQDNEKAKFDAKNKREAIRSSVVSRVTNGFTGELQTSLRSMVNENFYSNRSFDAGLGEFKNAVTTATFTSNSYESTIDFSEEFRNEIGIFVLGVGVTGTFANTTSTTDTDSNTTQQDISSTISYTLKDNDRNNLLSVDVVNMFDGNGPVFVTRGGTTSCPYEGETTSVFFNNDNFDRNVVGSGGEVLSEATNRVYNAELSVEKQLLTNIPEDDNAIFTLLLKNTSETQSDLEFVLDFDSTSLNGLEINIEANGVNIFLPYNETIAFPLILSKPSNSSTYNYEDIRIFIHSPCALIDERRENFIDVSVEFKKSCSNASIASPENNWIFNYNEAYSVDINGNTTTNKLPITFTDFNADFNGFQKIDLQYRNENSSNWTKLASYYGSQALKDNAGDSEGIVIASSDSEFTFNWDIIANDIPDGTYEFRAISYCTDNITNSSEIITGTINLNAPVVFGTPKPSDGILDVGEDVTVRFNEAIFNRVTTNISVTGLQNQQEVNHDVSVFLDGSTNQIELPNQRLGRASFALQFWYHNNTSGSGKLISQENGINVSILGNHLTFSIAGETISTANVRQPINDSQYNFYSFVYQNGANPQLLILENGDILVDKPLSQELDINTNASIFIGGQNVIGNLHDVRLWSRTFTRAQAALAKDLTLTGRELNLLGYWKLDEGFGKSGLDKAKRKNAIVHQNWAIFPKGTGYEFKNNEYLTLDNVGFIQPTSFEDKTLSFWIKPSQSSSGTIFSNGKGDASEPTLTSGFKNKWAVNLNNDGHLELMAENISYKLTSKTLPLNSWTHVAIVHKVGGSLNSYINGNEESSVSSSKMGGFTGNKILIGARLFEDFANNETIDNHFTGLLDEVRFWNTARSLEQIKRDRYFEIDNNAEGLLLKIDFNEDATNTSSGPAYNHLAANLIKGTTFAKLSGATQNYTQDSPPLKPTLQFTNIPFTTVINGDEMIIQPDLTDEEWSLFEGEIINFSVSRVSDAHFNTQLSPVTWAALVNRQEIEWFTKDQTKEIVAQKNIGEPYTFTMDVVNIGGSNQPFTIAGLPTWLKAEITTGSVAPNANKQITFTANEDLAMGNYSADIFLRTASGFNDRLSFSLRVLSEAPDWSVNAPDYNFSMNIIGKIQINNNFSRDIYTKIGAFVNDKPKGEAYLQYDEVYDSYFVFLTLYSNESSGDEVTFKIWDANNGKIIKASIDGLSNITFLQNEILGSKATPKVFSSTNLSEQNMDLNQGWTWVSFFVEDVRFNNLLSVFGDLDVVEDDLIKNQNVFARFENNNWNGLLRSLRQADMYKIKLAKANQLSLKGTLISEADFDLNISIGWNWLPFPIHRNIELQEALAFYNPTEGDVIKDQFSFAIYDTSSGWSGSLNYLEANQGYMLKSATNQTFNYPETAIAAKSSIAKNKFKEAKNHHNHFAQFSGNMSVIAEVIADENFDKVAVLDQNNVLRGVSEIITLNNKQISFISVFSNYNDVLKFVLMKNTDEFNTQESFVFVDNNVLGSLKKPIILSTKALSLNNDMLTDAILYPNPFTNEITIDFTNKNIEISKIEIFNTIGVSLQSKSNILGAKTIFNTTALANGIYIIRITDSSGKHLIKKMIKE